MWPFYQTVLYRPALPPLPPLRALQTQSVLHPKFNAAEAEARFLRSDPGFVVVDNFLSLRSVAALRTWAEEATIWHDIRRGYLGAHIGEGLLNGVLAVLVAELRLAFPRVIGELPLVNMWAYKYQQGGGVNRGIGEWFEVTLTWHGHIMVSFGFIWWHLVA